MITGWIITAIVLAVSGFVLERGRKRQQKMLSASAAAQFAMTTSGGVWSVARGEAVRMLPSGHRVKVRGTPRGWDVDFIDFRVAPWLPLAMVRGQKKRKPSIIDDVEAFAETFVPWDEGEQLRLDRFRRLLEYREVRAALHALYDAHYVSKFVSSASHVSIGVRLVDIQPDAAERFVERATVVMLTLERACVAAASNLEKLPPDVASLPAGHATASGSPTGAPLGVPSAGAESPR